MKIRRPTHTPVELLLLFDLWRLCSYDFQNCGYRAGLRGPVVIVALHDAFRVKAPIQKRLMLGAIGVAGVGLFLYAVIKIYVLSYWE